MATNIRDEASITGQVEHEISFLIRFLKTKTFWRSNYSLKLKHFDVQLILEIFNISTFNQVPIQKSCRNVSSTFISFSQSLRITSNFCFVRQYAILMNVKSLIFASVSSVQKIKWKLSSPKKRFEESLLKVCG